MFDTNAIGKRIASLRKRQDMTQMELADRMGVSFQAVSNWERGNSMPDIGRLQALADALDTTIDTLLGDAKAAEVVEGVLKDGGRAIMEEGKASADDVIEVAPILKPTQAKRLAEGVGGTAEGIDLKKLLKLAPFLDEETLDELADRVKLQGGVKDLAKLAPFLSKATLDRLARNALKDGGSIKALIPLAPFLDERTLDALVEQVIAGGGDTDGLLGLAPFLSGQGLQRLTLLCFQKR